MTSYSLFLTKFAHSVLRHNVTNYSLRYISVLSPLPMLSCTNLLCISCVKAVINAVVPVTVERHCSFTRLQIAIPGYTLTCVAISSSHPRNNGPEFIRICRIKVIVDSSIVVAIERYRSFHLCCIYFALYTLGYIAMVTYCFGDFCSNLLDVCGVEVVFFIRLPVTVE